jgi:hypothetical protein
VTGEEETPQSLFSRRRIRILYLAAVLLGILALAYYVRDAVNPFLFALLIAYILNPAVQFLERRAHLPRTAAILVIYLAAGGALVGAGIYSVGKTAVGFDKLVTKVAGGWQLVPGGIPAGPMPVSPTATAPTPASLTATAAGSVVVARRIPGLPVYGDDEILPLPNSPTIGFIDLNGNRRLDTAEPIFERNDGRWRPTADFAPFVTRVPGYLDDVRARIAERLPSVDKRLGEEVAQKLHSGTAERV